MVEGNQNDDIDGGQSERLFTIDNEDAALKSMVDAAAESG